MRIDRVEATAFGPLAEEILDLAPGMTVIHGPNEAGKSSWHAALYAGLCGMRRAKGRLRNEDSEFRDRHRPWDGEGWIVATRVTLDAGPVIELRHDLDGRVDCSAIDLTTAKDMSNEILHDGAPDGARFLGLTRRTFLSTVCVRQTETMSVLDAAEGLQEQLQRAAASSGRDSTAEAALRRLEDFRRDQVGLNRSNSTKPLRSALDAEEAARSRLAEAEAAHAEYLELVRDRDRRNDRVRELAGRRKETVTELDALRLRELRDRVERIREMASGFPDGPPPELDADEALDGQVTRALSRFEARPDEPDEPAGPTVAELETAIAALPPSPDGDVEPHPGVIEAERAWLLAEERLRGHGETRPATGEDAAHRAPASAHDLRQAADDLEAALPSVDDALQERLRALQEPGNSRGSLPWLLPVGSAVAIVGLVLLALAPAPTGIALSAAGLVLVVAGAVGRGTRSTEGGELARLQAQLSVQQASHDQGAARRGAAVRRCEEWGVPADSATLRSRARSLEDASHAADRLAAWEEQHERLTSEVEELTQELQSALVDRGVTVDRDVAEAVTTYRENCRARAQQAREADRGSLLETQLQHRVEADVEHTESLRRRREAEAEILHVAAALGVASDEAEGAAQDLRAWQERRSQQRREQQRAAQAWARLEEALAGRTLEDLEDQLAEAERRAGEAAEAGLSDRTAEELEQVIETATAAIREERTQADGLAGEVRERERTLASVAEAEEALAEATAELARVQRLKRTLEHTTRFLEEARDRVHRDIAPVLAGAVTDRLSDVTGGRYTEAIVDPASLEVRVRGSDGQLRDATLLSRGTAEQVYLLLRLAMAEHLVTTQEVAPFILDDALVQTDSIRAAAILDMLHEISAERQVIVFSQEDDVLAWAEEHLHDERDRLVLLPAP